MVGCRRWFLLLSVAASIAAGCPAQGDDELKALLDDATKKLRRGELTAAAAKFDEVLDAIAEEGIEASHQPLVDQAQIGLWTIGLRRGKYEAVRDEIAAAPPSRREQRDVVFLDAEVHQRVGAYADSKQRLEALVARDENDLQARHELGEVLFADGQRIAARALWEDNAGRTPSEPVQMAYRGRSLFRLGGRKNLELASRACVDALGQAPTLAVARVTYAQIKLAAYGETARFPSGEPDLKKALDENGDDEDALLAMYRLRSANMALDAGKTERFLERVLDRNDRCVEAIVLRAANVLDDRRYRDAARLLDTALAIDANDRTALCHRAATALLLHEDESYTAFRTRALAGDPGWPDCDRIIGDHLVALYRFADALPFYAAAKATAPDDIATLHGMAKALIYTGQGRQAKELLERAKALADGTVDAWRGNALAVQDLLDTQYTIVENDKFTVQMHRDDAEVLQAYLLPIQLEAAEVLGAKYAWRPEQSTRFEVFQTWDDFSVRTIGFRGFTALGACFGRLITMVSPVDGDLRRNDFMWEATAWHEYTHVLTLGLSKHRVPRWLTEGFSVFEEKMRDPSWERGMDRELFDAFHNQDIPPVHLLNRLFRGPRILFGYFQGGLIVELLAKEHGFPKALELLRAFGDDLETEDAFQRALGISSREFDRRFLDFVQREKLRSVRLVPRLDDAAMQRAIVRAGQDRSNVQARIDLAWACVQRGNPVDAGRWLAEVLRADPDNGQALLVRAALLQARKDGTAALDCWKRGFAAGADDFDSRIAYGDALHDAGDDDGAIDQWQRAKACWPACTEQQSAPELRLARLYRDRSDRTQAQMEMKAYCRRTARAFTPRWTLAEFEREGGNRAEEARYLVECNRIDPFHRELHVLLGDAYVALGKKPQAALEYEVAAAVMPAFDRRYLQRGTTRPEANAPEELQQRGELWIRAAKLRHELGDDKHALDLLRRVEREAAQSDAAGDAKQLIEEWQRD